jgi:Tfp pilus assembly protein FimT
MPELMVVIVIVGILSGLAIPNFQQRWEDERLNSAAKLTTSWLEDLRRKAIQNSTVCRAVIDSAAATFTGTCDHQPTQSSILDLQQEITNTSGLSFSLQGGSPSTWVFTPRGTTTTDGDLRINLVGSRHSRCLRLLEPLGSLRSGKLRSGLCVYTTSY